MSDKISSSKAVQVTSAVTVSMIEHLTKQQGIIIKLMEEIAHGAKQEKEEAVQSDESYSSDDQHRPDPEKINRQLKLYRAALNGDWQVARGIYEVHKEDIGAEISDNGYTALHIAAASRHISFVKELVKMLDEKDITCRTERGGITALSFAAASGKVEIAEELVGKNKAIAMVPDVDGDLPIEVAASLGHREMVNYLYGETKLQLEKNDLIQLLVTLIKTDLYDVALQLLNDRKELAIARSRNGETALHALALKHLPSSNGKVGFLRRCFNLGTNNVENRRHPAVELVECLWKELLLLGEPKISDLIASPRKLIFDAAKQGNHRFLSILIREYPDLIWKFNNADHPYSIYHTAVLYRQENIFKFIHEIGSAKDLLLLTKDNEGNNILHLAAKLAPADRLNIVSGPALQMQRELLWFKEVKGVVKSRQVEAINKQGFTPGALFTEEHEKLREKGEEWMKSTAESCMVVATLIATVVFAAAITVPGGNNGETGLPIFHQKASFKIFVISDLVSLVCSCISIVTFLSILTSRYAEEDFVSRLPRKLLVGLATLFISIATLMMVFSTTVFILFIDGTTWIAILVTLIASAPVLIFCYQKWRLFYDVVRWTYVKDSLFEKGKSHLFYKEGEASECQKSKQFETHLSIRCTCSTNV